VKRGEDGMINPQENSVFQGLAEGKLWGRSVGDKEEGCDR
jgi:hypothetical protein